MNTPWMNGRGQLIAFYIGDHKGDSLTARLGVALIRWAQKGAKFADSSHVEQVLAVHPDGTVDIGSATLRKENARTGGNGVRVKRGVRLKKGNWRLYWCPQQGAIFNPDTAITVLHLEDGVPYDHMGAVASAVLRIGQSLVRWFCSEIVMTCAGFLDGWQFTPARAEAVIASYGVDVTDQFFGA